MIDRHYEHTLLERIFGRPMWEKLRQQFAVFDGLLMLILGLLAVISLITLYSAGIDFPGRFEGQLRNFAVAFVMMWILAHIPPQTLIRFAVPVYTVGVALLIAVAMFGLRNASR